MQKNTKFQYKYYDIAHVYALNRLCACKLTVVNVLYIILICILL